MTQARLRITITGEYTADSRDYQEFQEPRITPERMAEIDSENAEQAGLADVVEWMEAGTISTKIEVVDPQ